MTTRIPELVLVEHEFEVPLRHSVPGGTQITIFAREVAAPDGLDRPFLLFLQGGPGFEAERPTGTSSPSWLERALKDFRVLMLDQRGTGRSTPVGSLDAMSPEQQTDYLTCFRADSIVMDAELIRKTLGVERWSLLGQSFGGFCALRYLSSAPQGLREALFCGGLAPIAEHPDRVYEATYLQVIERCERYYERYPEDLERVRTLHEWMKSSEVRLPGGDRLTTNMFRQLGSMLGIDDGAEQLHYILEMPPGSPAFLHEVEAGLPPFVRNPLYAIVHEACYADGVATEWSAGRTKPAVFDERPELFTGEHVFPWMFDDYSGLRPLREAAHLLAAHKWPRLYDEDRLARCGVHAAAVIYADDMYVARSFSERTAKAMPKMRVWLTNEYEHNGLRADGGRILDRLLALVRGD
ncbi:MAG: alpha/beta fold hydrolase [Acidimicrobiales bacterium]